jgi:hypothetical protein
MCRRRYKPSPFRDELMRAPRLLTCLGLLLISGSAGAHELLMRYNLPVPFRLYLYTCAATLLVTFLLFGWFMRAPAGGANAAGGATRHIRPLGVVPSWAVYLLRFGALACLCLTIVGGLIGTKDPDDNLNLTLFWDIFLLGITYATVLVGNVYGVCNPWQTVVELLRWFKVDRARARFAYPDALGYWPAVAFYIALVWLELFTLPGPAALSYILIAYTVITLAGVWAFGSAAWFRRCEVFAVLFRLIGTLSPIAYQQRSTDQRFEMQLRWPLVGALEEHPKSISLVVFVLFILAGTTYDGMHQTLFWKGIFWHHILFYLQSAAGLASAPEAVMERWYEIYQRVGLVLAPFFYLGIYLLILQAAKLATRTTLPLRTLALALSLTILPIAFVYNLAHYFTLILVRTPVLPYLLTDPFGFEWNPLDLPHMGDPPVLNMAMVWHTEVALILIGHVLSVWLAHRVALRLFPSRRDAIISQVPMLLLMMAYTILGLWVISLPFALTGRG